MSRPRKPARLVRLKGNPIWYIRDGEVRTANGRSLQFSTETENREEAECTLAAYIAQKAMPVSPTIAQLLDIRLEALLVDGKPRGINNVYHHGPLKAFFGNMKPDQISTPLITRYKQESGQKPSMLREQLKELKSILLMAKREGLIQSFPQIDVPAKNPPRERFLTKEEAGMLLAQTPSPHAQLYIHIALATGHRKSAILGLTWDRVDLLKGRIDFNDPSKAINKKRRTVVPIAASLVDMLLEAQRFRETDFVIEYVGKPVKDIRKAIERAASRAGLKDVSAHTLKHTAISWLAQAGHSIDKISEFTATHHETVRRIYRKHSPDFLQEEANLLAGNLDYANQFAKLKKKDLAI